MISTLKVLLKIETEHYTKRILHNATQTLFRNGYHSIPKTQNEKYSKYMESQSLRTYQPIHFLSRRAFWCCNYHLPSSSALTRNLYIRKSSILNKDKNIDKFSEGKKSQVHNDIFGSDSKLTLFEKFKLMYKKYWYVLIPVHIITSIGWLTGFYYLSKSGVDLPSLLKYLHLSESYIQKAQNSDMAHYAIAYICYKVITPLRYAMSLGGTTVTIKYLAQAGYIKPVPSGKEFMQMYQDKKKPNRTKTKEDSTKEETN